MSAPLSLSPLNDDASWLLTLGSERWAVDPWLVEAEIDGCSLFNSQRHREGSCASPAAVGALTGVLITQPFSDHCHESTLLLLEGAPTVYTVPSALSRARACLGRERVQPLSALAAALPGWYATHIPPPLLEPTHGGVLLCTPGGSVLIAPHGLRAPTLARALGSVDRAPRPLTVLATTATYALPSCLGGVVNLGLANAAEICAAVRADSFYSNHAESGKTVSGCVPMFASATYASTDEIAAAIACAQPLRTGGAIALNAGGPLQPPLRPPPQISQADAAAEAPVTAEILRAMSARVPRVDRNVDSVRVYKEWNKAARTHTFHTHVFVSGADSPSLLERVSDLFLNAYGHERHGWYAQFVRGVPTPCAPGADGGAQRCGWGLFELGIGKLRAWHTRFSLFTMSPRSSAVVLRTVIADASAPLPDGTVQVFLLPPTGDFFVLADGGLHWHHICTVRGVRILPDALDGALMTALRSTGADAAERATYEKEGRSFIEFARGKE